MRLTDQIEDVRRLEEEFGFETIEYFIQSLANEINLVDYAKQLKPWEM
jgi:NADH dehydrogenase (ubiquinone) 1 alpha subcomplex subunit 5